MSCLLAGALNITEPFLGYPPPLPQCGLPGMKEVSGQLMVLSFEYDPDELSRVNLTRSFVLPASHESTIRPNPVNGWWVTD